MWRRLSDWITEELGDDVVPLLTAEVEVRLFRPDIHAAPSTDLILEGQRRWRQRRERSIDELERRLRCILAPLPALW
jgi:hypothetical protein